MKTQDEAHSTQSELLADQEDREDARSYFLLCAEGLKQEISSYIERGERQVIDCLIREIAAFISEVPKAAAMTPKTWNNLWSQYRGFVHRKAALLNESSAIAHSYSGMEEFWADAEAQAAGLNDRTFWDVYEHGRRRQIEQILAATYGSEDALLVNSGMSALAVLIGMSGLRVGKKLLTTEQGYFETTDYLDRFVAACGVEIVRSSADLQGQFLRGIRELCPDLILLETVTITPDVPIPSISTDWLSATPKTLFVIDNSTQSHLTRYFDLFPGHTSNLLVFESATKYLSEECMAGVIYGSKTAMDKVRDFARATGQQLQEKAFNYICTSQITSVHRKLARHAGNVAAFKAVLREYSGVLTIRTLDHHAAATPEASNLFRSGTGALVFALVRSDDHEPSARIRFHRELLDRWRSCIPDQDVELPIRAGYGWNQTVARVYEGGKLSQNNTPIYLRISIGIEPVEVIRQLAQSLGMAAVELGVGNQK